MDFVRFLCTEHWICIDKLSSIAMVLSGLMATQGAVTYIIAIGYAAHSLVEWLP